ncbi:hypothetical protein [Acetobacter cibinongensis]|uniref:Uncharacterized protein n=1 Tax=Acetobacter cibinongensis TaxID=146475 RepID=A0A1Z5YV73_9PROT|nr:hypothetical protein [Acetobacter cibinongensis]OUJ02688.1 hypothetical protein HK14_05175 [Acetobacter cibinongensis]
MDILALLLLPCVASALIFTGGRKYEASNSSIQRRQAVGLTIAGAMTLDMVIAKAYLSGH